MNIEQERYHEELHKLNSATKNLGQQLHAITSNIYLFDLFLISALNRTINLNKAFIELNENKNFIAAAPLVRINLDTLLRLYAARVSNLEINDFARKIILEGKKVKNLKSYERNPNGKLKNLSDNYLKKSLSQIEGYEWVEKIYDIGSSFVHLDSKIFFASRKVVSEEEKTMITTIGYHDFFIPQNEKSGAAYWMLKITEGIIDQAKIWIVEKADTYNYDILKLNDPRNLKTKHKSD